MRTLIIKRTVALTLAGMAVLVGWVGEVAATGDLPIAYRLNNGITARIHTADDLAGRLVTYDSKDIIPLDDGSYLTVVTDIDDPMISNKGDGEFHPFDAAEVAEILGEIKYPNLALDVEIYLLPFPRTNVMVSSTSGHKIFLSPQMYEISRENAAYIVAHELGHAFQDRYLPIRAVRRWDEYRQIRGITGVEYSSDARHSDRPAEIFAEDFRVFFGGPSAYSEGRVENSEIAQPEMVPGLRSFFASLAPMSFGQPFIVGMRNAPNPFNPSTEIQLELRDEFVSTGQNVTINVYDVRGALVRELYSGRPSDRIVRVRWDGRDRNGRDVASATYFGVARAGDTTVTQKLLMVK